MAFEQVLVRHTGEPSNADLATAYGTSVDDAMLFFPPVGFEQMAFQGFPVQRLAAIRTHSTHGRAARGYGVFVDPRDLGRPLCFRLFRTRTVTVDMLLRAVEVELPEGVEAMMEGNDVVGSELFIPDAGAAVSLCAGFVFVDEPTESSGDPSAPADSDDVAGKDPESDEVHRAEPSDRADEDDRSRSPPPRSGPVNRYEAKSTGCDLRSVLRSIAAPLRSARIPEDRSLTLQRSARESGHSGEGVQIVPDLANACADESRMPSLGFACDVVSSPLDLTEQGRLALQAAVELLSV